jgi:hypothetical protein
MAICRRYHDPLANFPSHIILSCVCCPLTQRFAFQSRSNTRRPSTPHPTAGRRFKARTVPGPRSAGKMLYTDGGCGPQPVYMSSRAHRPRQTGRRSQQQTACSPGNLVFRIRPQKRRRALGAGGGAVAGPRTESAGRAARGSRGAL